MSDDRIAKAWRTLRWLPIHNWQRIARGRAAARATDVIIAVADHFEPSIDPAVPKRYAPRDEQLRRVDRWRKEMPKALDRWRDAEGFRFRHTYFYPAEQYDPDIVEEVAELCRAGWGEVEIHLHHGVDAPDTSKNTRRSLVEFRDRLVRHGCLSHSTDDTMPRYGFVHGNWALANSAGGRDCGVDDELQILADTGCYADFTLPSAPHPAQVAKINAIYECIAPLDVRAAHRRGRDLRRGSPPQRAPLVVQGPLGLWPSDDRGWRRPYVENGALTGALPPTIARFRRWIRPPITVRGAEEWLFVKLHCHGMDPRDEDAMFGEAATRFLSDLAETNYRLHFVTAREMVNIALAACDGREGNAGEYRDYRLRLLSGAGAAG